MGYLETKNSYIKYNDVTFAYRELGEKKGIPILMFNHLAATLDNWDPILVDTLANGYRIILFDNLGVGGSSGMVQDSIQEMAKSAYDFIKAMNLEKVHVLGMSMGGFVVQELLEIAPQVIDKVILAATGPRGGIGIDKVTRITFLDMFRGSIRGLDPKRFLFFNNDNIGKKEALKFLERINSRKEEYKDEPIKVKAFLKQLKAIKKWSKEESANLSSFDFDILLVNGDNDRMVPTINTHNMNQKIKKSKMIIYTNSGHGAIFQFPKRFASDVDSFIKQ